MAEGGGSMRAPKNLTKTYENQCPLIAWEVRERLSESRLRRDSQLHQQIEMAEARLRKRQEDLESVHGDRKAWAARVALEATALAKKTAQSAAAVAADGVREFANALLVSQRRLGVHAVILREYTAVLVNEIRSVLSTSAVFRSNPLLPWAEDPIAQKAMETCEEVIAERRKLGDRWSYGTPLTSTDNLTWVPIVQEWEMYKALNKLESGVQERVPESVLRTFLARHYRITPQEVDREQIRQAGTELCCHYGPILMVPLELKANPSAQAPPESKGDRQFWKEREGEFRKHGRPTNPKLSGEWYSLDGQWTFRSGSDRTASTWGTEQIFKSLAREAAKGFAGPASSEPWLDWVEALRGATDRSTGKRLYAKVSTIGSLVYPEGDLERMAKSGEPVPPVGLIEFVVSEEPEGHAHDSAGRGVSLVARAEMRTYWDTTKETIENLFTNSANFCLELRSRIPKPESSETAASTEKQTLPSCPTVLGRNLSRLKMECGWSVDDLAKETGINRSLILDHLNQGKKAYPSTLAKYAAAFTTKLGRAITPAALLEERQR